MEGERRGTSQGRGWSAASLGCAALHCIALARRAALSAKMGTGLDWTGLRCGLSRQRWWPCKPSQGQGRAILGATSTARCNQGTRPEERVGGQCGHQGFCTGGRTGTPRPSAAAGRPVAPGTNRRRLLRHQRPGAPAPPKPPKKGARQWLIEHEAGVVRPVPPPGHCVVGGTGQSQC